MKKFIANLFELGITKTKLILTILLIIVKFKYVSEMSWFFVLLPLYLIHVFVLVILIISLVFFLCFPKKSNEIIAKMYKSKLKAV